MGSTSDSSSMATQETMRPSPAFLASLYRPSSASDEKLTMYDEVARQNDVLYPDAEAHRHCADLLLSRLSPGNVRVLDAGCGTGQLALYLRGQAHRDDLALSLVGVDCSADMLRLAGATGVFDDLLQRNISAPFELPGEPFDVAFAAGVFAHDRIGAQAIVHVAQHVRPGGLFVLSVLESTFDEAADEYRRCFDQARCTVVANEMASYGVTNTTRANYFVLKKSE